jgi:hypothetical protein
MSPWLRRWKSAKALVHGYYRFSVTLTTGPLKTEIHYGALHYGRALAMYRRLKNSPGCIVELHGWHLWKGLRAFAVVSPSGSIWFLPSAQDQTEQILKGLPK